MNHEDLPSLALVNRFFFDVATPWIWRDLTVGFTAMTRFDYMARRLNTLLDKLEQGMKVTDLHFIIERRVPETQLNCFRTGVRKLLARSSDLKSLTLCDWHGLLDLPLMISNICPSIRLVELNIHFAISPVHWDFLLSQPTIRRLVLNCHFNLSQVPDYRSSHIPTGVLPQLEVLFAPIDVVTRLLPGRPVRYVGIWFLSSLEFNSLWQVIAESTATLTALSIGTEAPTELPALFEQLPSQTPSLRFLGIITHPHLGRQTVTFPMDGLAPLYSLEMLECMRWDLAPATPGFDFESCALCGTVLTTCAL